MFTGAISTFAFGGRPSPRRPLSGVKVDGRDSREREAQVGAISARALRLNTKTDVWPSGRGGGAHYLEDKHYPLERRGQLPDRLAKPPMSAPKVVCAGIRVPYVVLTADEAPLDWPQADGESMRSEKATEEDGQSVDAGMLSVDEASRGMACHASGEDNKGAGTGARAQAGQNSVDMWRGAGEDIRFDAGGGIQADADRASVTKLPGWLFYVPLVIISLEPARKGMWDTLAFSRHAHAQLEGSWTSSSGADGVMAAPPANEPPQPHTARAKTQARDNFNITRVDKLKTSPWLASLPTETPRRFPDRLMGEQISNVQWRSSLRTNSNVVGLALALPQAPRQQAAKDSLRDPPASERGHALHKGRKLIQSISPVETDSNSYFPVRIMRQVPFSSSCAKCVLSARSLDLLTCLRERASVCPLAPAWGACVRRMLCRRSHPSARGR